MSESIPEQTADDTDAGWGDESAEEKAKRDAKAEYLAVFTKIGRIGHFATEPALQVWRMLMPPISGGSSAPRRSRKLSRWASA